MAIFDNDTLVQREVSKVYDSDGSVQHEIKEVFDLDGLVQSPVFSSSTPIFENGVWNSALCGSYNLSCGTGTVHTVSFQNGVISFSYQHTPSVNKWAHAIVWTGQAVNLSGYSKLCLIAGNMRDSAKARLLVATTPPVSDNPQYQATTYADITSDGLLELSVADLSGSYYIGIDGTPNGSWNYKGSHDVSAVWLE